MPDFLLLILEFLKTGLFAVGGGYATLPYLYEMAENYDWFTLNDLNSFIAVSEVTPGPIGINMATFAGNLTGGILGGVAASVAVVLLPCILVALLLKFVPDITENNFMKKLFYGLIPCAAALILAAAFSLFKNALLGIEGLSTNIISWLLFFALTFAAFYRKASPFLLLFIGGIIGLLFL